MKEIYIEKNFWHKLECINITSGGYKAMIIPEIGANMVKLTHEESGVDILRTPSNAEALKESPVTFGLPVLFMPNRIADGIFYFNSQKYKLPVNQVEEGNHLHGFLYNRPWQITKTDTTSTYATVTLEFSNNETSDFFKYFPHDFVVKLTYTLSENGLEQNVIIQNNGSEKMPFGLGFHSAFNVPFNTNSDPSDYTLKVPLGNYWPRDARNLPTGEINPLSEYHQKLAAGTCNPATELISDFFSTDKSTANKAVITDRKNNISINYSADESYGFWILWNDGGNSGFVCPEPQTMMANAPNINLPWEKTGMNSIDPGEQWSGNCSIKLCR